MTDLTPAAVWLRVSTDEERQHTGNQMIAITKFAAHHDLEIVRKFTVDDSAWQNGKGGPEYQRTLKAALDGAWQGHYKVIVVWAVDRITRLGAEDALRLIRRFRERGCTLLSVQEQWLNSSPEIVDVLVAFAGWAAQQESSRRSDRIKAGIARRKADGLPVGRKAGSRDSRPRRRSGYVAAWEAGGKRRSTAARKGDDHDQQ